MFNADGILNVVVIELLAGFVTKFECIAMYNDYWMQSHRYIGRCGKNCNGMMEPEAAK